jgi:hypothetical protein
MVAGNKYTFNVTGTMDGSQITLSKDNQANSYSTFKEDGTTPAIGTDYNGITKITVDFDGAKCSIVSLDKIIVDLETQQVINTANIPKIDAKVNQALPQIARNTGKLLTGSLTDATQGEYYIDNDGFSFGIEPDTYGEALQSDRVATTTVIDDLSDTSTLLAGMELTVQDDLSKEFVEIVSVDSATQITITALVNSYTTANNAEIYRSSTETMTNLLVNGDVATSFDPGAGNASLMALLLAGTWAAGTATFSTSRQVFNVDTARSYYVYCKVSQGQLRNQVGLTYNDNTVTRFGLNTLNITELSLIFTPDKTLPANQHVVENDGGDGQIIIREYQLFIDLTANGLEDLTEPELKALAQQGYFEGDKTFTAISQDSDTRAKITGNFGLAKDWIYSVIKYNNDGVDPTVNIAASFSDDNVESYVSIPQLKEFDDGADKVKHYKLALDSVITPATNIFLRTTTIKDDVGDVQTILEEYGQVVNLEEV